MRLTGTALDCYKYLEPLYYDYRKIKRQSRQGGNFIIKLISYNLKQRIHACSKRGKKPIQNNFRNRLIHYPETINVNEYIFMHPPLYTHTFFGQNVLFAWQCWKLSPYPLLKLAPHFLENSCSSVRHVQNLNTLYWTDMIDIFNVQKLKTLGRNLMFSIHSQFRQNLLSLFCVDLSANTI